MFKRNLFKCEIYNNVIMKNNKKITLDREIIDYIISSNVIVVLEKYTGDDFEIVYCFDNELNLLWKIKKPDNSFFGKTQLPYIGLSFNEKICVVDTLGRNYSIDVETGEIVGMKCIRF